MKSFMLYVTALMLSMQSISAALPPLAESIAELKTILESKEFADKLGMADSIQKIISIEEGWLFLTNRKKMIVDVIYKPSGIGPAKYDLKFHQPTQIDRDNDRDSHNDRD